MEKRIKGAGFLILSLLVVMPLFPVSFADAGLTVVSEKREGPTMVYVLKDPKGQEISAVLEGELTLQTVTGLSGIVKTFSEWKHLNVSSIKLRITPVQIGAGVIIQETVYKGITLNRHLPAGLQFFLRDTLEYDFRIAAQNNFVRLRGWYFNEEQLLNRVTDVIRNPGQFLKAQDPEFLFTLISALEQDLSNLTQKYDDLLGKYNILSGEYTNLAELHRALEGRHVELAVLQQEMEQAGINLYMRHGDLVSRYSDLLDRHEDLEDRYKVLKQSHEELAENHKILQEKHTDLESRHISLLSGYEGTAEELALLREAGLTVANRGLSSKGKAVDPGVVKRIIEIRQANPEILAKDIAKLLKAEGLSASSREIFLVLALYLNIYE